MRYEFGWPGRFKVTANRQAESNFSVRRRSPTERAPAASSFITTERAGSHQFCFGSAPKCCYRGQGPSSPATDMSALGIRLIGSSLSLRSFPALRQAAPSTSTQSRSFCSFASTSLRPKHPKSSPQSRHTFLRSLSSESPAPTRHALGRITPKRIAVRAPRSQFRSSSSAEFDPDLPEKTIWRPIIVGRIHLVTIGDRRANYTCSSSAFY